MLFRATEQWFCSVEEDFKEDAVKAIQDVQWIPDWGEDRIIHGQDRRDWCISRPEKVGVPIPIFLLHRNAASLDR